MYPGKWYEDLSVGERFGTSVTVTEARLEGGAALRQPTA